VPSSDPPSIARVTPLSGWRCSRSPRRSIACRWPEGGSTPRAGAECGPDAREPLPCDPGHEGPRNSDEGGQAARRPRASRCCWRAPHDDAVRSSDAGVPARAAQPVAAGPVAYQSSRASGASRSADPAAIRAPGQVEGSASRTITAATTAAVRASASTCIQPTRPSLPVPSAWTRAIGQAAYASQWNRRHVRKPKRPRRKLVMVSASSRSKATAPSPSQTGLYAEPKGTWHPAGRSARSRRAPSWRCAVRGRRARPA
jgi:hypothetical protein